MKFCEQCGAQIPDGALVCPACGRGTQPPQPQWTQQPQAAPAWGAQAPAAPQPPKPAKGKGGGKILFLLLGIVIAGAVTAALLATGVLQFGSGGEPTAAKVEGRGYASAEEAARAYAEALKAGDMDAMLSTFAVESYVEHFDAAACLNGVRSTVFSFGSSNAPMPPADRGLELALNLEGRRIQIVQSVYYQYISRLLHGTEYEDSLPRPITFAEPEDVSAFMELLRQDPGFSGMTIGSARYAKDFLDGEQLENFLSYADQRAGWYGVQDMRDVCLELTIDGEDYYLFILTICYNGKWYNGFFQGQLGAYLGVNTMSGGLVPVDAIEY